jgi:putative tryptophan/tyrosine transport system substrate-binding protein
VELNGAFVGMARKRPDSLIVVSDPFLMSRRGGIIAAATQHNLPAMCGFRENVVEGGLMSYGASNPDLYRRAAVFVDKILRGAKPSDLPVEQATAFELVINAKTAKILGLTVPPSLLLRADQVIQ